MKQKILMVLLTAIFTLKSRAFVGLGVYSPWARVSGSWTRFAIGAGCWFGRCHLCARGGGKVVVGAHCHVEDGVVLRTYGGEIIVGDHVSLNSGVYIHGGGGVTIGNNCRVGPRVMFFSANHNFSDPSRLIMDQGETRLGIVLGNDVWVGAGAIILDGVSIGDGCVIGAGSIVTRSVDAGSIIHGVPARIVGSRLSS